MTVPIIASHQPFNPFTSIQLIGEHTDNVRLMCKLDDLRFASASDDGSIKLWNIENGSLIFHLVHHTQRVTCIQPRDNSLCHLISASADKSLCLWDIANGACILNVSCGMSIKCLLQIPNSSFILACGGSVHLIDLSTGKNLAQCSINEELIHFQHQHQIAADGVNIAEKLEIMENKFHDDSDSASGVEAYKEQQLEEIWKTVEQQHTPDSLVCEESNPSQSISDSSHIIYVQENRFVVAVDEMLLVFKYDLDNNIKMRIIQRLPNHKESITCLINVTENYFCSASCDGSIQMWTSNGLYLLKTLKSHYPSPGTQHGMPYAVHHLLCIDKRFVFAAVGQGFTLYDMRNCRTLVHRTVAHYSSVLSMELICDGYILLTCSEDGTIRLWGNEAHISYIYSHSSNNILNTAFPIFTGLTKDDTKGTAKTTSSPTSASPIDNFLGMWKTKLKQGIVESCEANLLGECLGHSGAVQMLLKVNEFEFVSCGNDRQIIVWIDSEMKNDMMNNTCSGNR